MVVDIELDVAHHLDGICICILVHHNVRKRSTRLEYIPLALQENYLKFRWSQNAMISTKDAYRLDIRTESAGVEDQPVEKD